MQFFVTANDNIDSRLTRRNRGRQWPQAKWLPPGIKPMPEVLCLFISLALLFLVGHTAIAEPIELVDATGVFKIKCEVISISAGKVTVKRHDGVVLDVPLNRLDQESLIAVIKELNSRLPKANPVAEKPKLPPAAQELANRKALAKLKETGFQFEIKPIVNIPAGELVMQLAAQNNLDALEEFRSVTDLTQITRLRIYLDGGRGGRPAVLLSKRHIATLNLFTGLETIEIFCGRESEPNTRSIQFLEQMNLPRVKRFSLRGSTQLSDRLVSSLLKNAPNIEELILEPSEVRDNTLGTQYYPVGIDESFKLFKDFKKLRALTLYQQSLPEAGIDMIAGWVKKKSGAEVPRSGFRGPERGLEIRVTRDLSKEQIQRLVPIVRAGANNILHLTAGGKRLDQIIGRE